MSELLPSIISKKFYTVAWISAREEPPNDDQVVWTTNIRLQMLPIKAYYDLDSREFISVESNSLTPISVTHWVPLPENPKIPRK